ncbi:zinc finger protein 696-like isoform X1 [Anguilla rostrata]|uniref:zinc finger protein 696-like isoform X1 n=2 Tax=Anguilla rostrata TaxID=7938 RepID=UPI0030CE543A
MAYYGINVQKQLHSILDALTKDAVAEIGKLIEDGSAVLRLEIFHSQKENETLKMKLQEMERELKTAREYGKKGQEFKDAFATRYCLPAEEEDFRQCVIVEQSGELLSESVIKKERLEEQENCLGSDWRGDILEAERSVGSDWDSGLNGGVAAEVRPGPGAAPEPFVWAEPELMQGDGEDAYADFRYAGEGGVPGQAEGEAPGAEPFKEELSMQPVWAEEAGPGIGSSHRGRYREETDGRVAQTEAVGSASRGGRIPGPLRACSVRVECLSLQDSGGKRQNAAADEAAVADGSLDAPAPFLCPCCGKAFSWSVSLKRHLQTHEQRRPFRCALCPKSFPDQLHLTAHQRNHKRVRQFSCATCGKGFFRKHHLSSHQRTHTGERPYCCRYCGKDYKQLSNLISHQRSHTGERPYGCTQCGKSFHRLDNLKAHQRVHTRVRKFVCSFADCQESFDQKYLFESHQLSHVV